MRITHLEYKRTANLGNYENASLSATCQLMDGEEPDAAMQELRDWVETRVAEAADLAMERHIEEHDRLQGIAMKMKREIRA